MERTERFEASKSNEGRFRMLIDAITDYAIYMIDPDGTITSWNPGARRFKGHLRQVRGCGLNSIEPNSPRNTRQMNQ